MKKENNNLKQLMRCVNKEDELLSRRDIERRIDDINDGNPCFRRKQIIESQIALLEALLYKSTDIWQHITLSVSLIAMAVAIICSLVSINCNFNALFSIAVLYIVIVVGAAFILVFSKSSETKKENQVFLHRILSYMLEEIKENEKI